MQKKNRSHFVCQACGSMAAKWLGRCPDCQAWGTLVEELLATTPPLAVQSQRQLTPAQQPQLLATVQPHSQPRLLTGLPEFDRVLGGGLVPGSLVLVGGDPGIGKSTLLLQSACSLAAAQIRVLYVTAEESLQQVKMRAERLSLHLNDYFYVQSSSDIDAVIQTAGHLQAQVLLVDSVQTVATGVLSSTIGSVGQIRLVTQLLLTMAKEQHITTIIVGHVTKEGLLAGPKVMEHMVDTVLYFEGERLGQYRLLRAHKNRFGNAQEIGMFMMEAHGLVPVSNASQWLLAERGHSPGAVVVTSMEGTRPLLLEVQALVVSAPYSGNPRRTTTGFDPQRVSMLVAILAARCNIDLSSHDIFVNVAGGVRLSEPAADLGVILALVSAVRKVCLPSQWVVMGEVGLSGEVRAASQIKMRLLEATALGFTHALLPKANDNPQLAAAVAIKLVAVRDVAAALHVLQLLPS